MTNDEMELEISLHLNAATKNKIKEISEDTVYKLAMKQGDVLAALRRTLALIYGEAEDMAIHRRQMKKKRKIDEICEFV